MRLDTEGASGFWLAHRTRPETGRPLGGRGGGIDGERNPGGNAISKRRYLSVSELNERTFKQLR